jgi:hypothetical protein
MSYFRKMVERTLKSEGKIDNGSVKPAITPESIPDPFETNPRVGTRARRRISASNTNGVAKKQPADAASSGPDAKPVVEERRLSEQVEGTKAAASAVSATRQVAQPSSRDKAGAADPIMNPVNEQQEMPKERDGEEKERPVFDFVTIAPPAVLLAATEFGRADSASQTKPLKPNSLFSNDSSGSKYHPQLRPATGPPDKYSLAVTQTDETTITINIGRIEVRAISPEVKAPLLPRKEYSPSLSLDEYLRQRNEGKRK